MTYQRPIMRFTQIAVLATVALYGALTMMADWSMVQHYLSALSIVTVGLYGYDKSIAGTGATRIPEIVLLGLAIAGGACASIIAQQLFRHKTRKPAFRLTCFFLAVLQLAALLLLI